MLELEQAAAQRGLEQIGRNIELGGQLLAAESAIVGEQQHALPIRLEPDRQRMLLLAYYGAFSREQLAAKLDVPANLLKASLRRSLFELEQCLTS